MDIAGFFKVTKDKIFYTIAITFCMLILGSVLVLGGKASLGPVNYVVMPFFIIINLGPIAIALILYAMINLIPYALQNILFIILILITPAWYYCLACLLVFVDEKTKKKPAQPAASAVQPEEKLEFEE